MANLEAAWRQVRSNAERSQSHEVRDEARSFEKDASRKLKSIQSRLTRCSFQFKPAKGIAVKRKGKKPRPIVLAPIESRIVQRALLNIVQEIPKIKAELTAGFNFGGVPGQDFGVPAAIAKAITAIRSSGYYMRTDIKSFFMNVPRELATKALLEHVPDDKFKNLFIEATKTELDDLSRLGSDVKLFPLYETGVAQGSALSPLLCNYLLRNFDRQMNARNVVCIRYIDDFIIFAKDQATAAKAMKSALAHLQTLGLEAYDPICTADAKKAAHGVTSSVIKFLGCDLTDKKVRPSEEKRRNLLDRVEEIFGDCIAAIQNPSIAVFSSDGKNTFAGAVVAAGKVIRGWGNTYSFCNDDQLMRNIDIEINKLFEKFRNQYQLQTKHMSISDKRRSMGLFMIEDCNKDDDPNSARYLANMTLLN